jgi:Ca-activated chloride channel family protein
MVLKDRADGKTSLYDAIIRGSHLLESSAHERRVIIVLSDGQDTASRASLNSVINELRSSNTLLYAVGLFEMGDPDSSSAVLKKMAETTGGQLILDADGAHLNESFTAILKDLRSRYLLGFNSEDAASEKEEIRHLSVSITNPPSGHLHILARREYRIAPK